MYTHTHAPLRNNDAINAHKHSLHWSIPTIRQKQKIIKKNSQKVIIRLHFVPSH